MVGVTYIGVVLLLQLDCVEIVGSEMGVWRNELAIHLPHIEVSDCFSRSKATDLLGTLASNLPVVVGGDCDGY